MAELNTYDYWEERYKSGGDSGSCSQGRLGQFKAEIINDFAEKHNIKVAADFGCGDGEMSSLLKFEKYYGFELSPTAVGACQKRFAGDQSRAFLPYVPQRWQQNIPILSELALSLDVVYFILEDVAYTAYLNHLLQLPSRFVIIYSSNVDQNRSLAAHLRNRKFTNWISLNRPDWVLAGFVPNRHPFEPTDSNRTSISDFYIFSHGEAVHPSFAVYQPQKPEPVPEGTNPEPVNIRSLLATARESLAARKTDEALRDLEKVLTADPFNSAALNYLGILFFNQGRLSETETVFKRWLAYDPENPEARNSLAK
ncbi:MAG: tetratricopeptide repeat protein, partial [Deltaproteobacteria bacterium]|nr:tetratricopeptide repeat protein [Deltaproteobacteria bacterium]